jgi:hypothetical protein
MARSVSVPRGRSIAAEQPCPQTAATSSASRRWNFPTGRNFRSSSDDAILVCVYGVVDQRGRL